MYARRYPQAIEALDRVLAEDQSFQEAHIYLVEAYLASAKFEQALAELDRYPNWAREPWSLDRRAFALAKLGRVVEARRAIEEVERRAECTGCASFGYIGLGDTEKALASYEGAVRRRFVSATSLKVHPLVDSLRNEARFQALLRTVGL